MVREFEKEGLPTFDVILDLSCPWVSAEQFELAVSAAASMVQLGHTLGIHPDLIFLEPSLLQEAETRKLSGRSADIDQQLLLLAELDFKKIVAAQKSWRANSAQDASVGGDKALVFVTAASASPLPLALPQADQRRPSESEESWETQALSSARNNVFSIKVSPTIGTAAAESDSNEFLLSKVEDFLSL